MARPKGSASALGDLPVDPLVEILSRVPAMSVCRFKCVSKAWRDLIADPDHRKKLPQAMQGLFCKMYEYDKSSMANRFSFVDLTARSVPLDIDSSFSFLTELPGIHVLYLLGSCNGLVLFEHYDQDSCDDTPPPPLPLYSVQPDHKGMGNRAFLRSYTANQFRLFGFRSGSGISLQLREEGQLQGWRHRVRSYFVLQMHDRAPFVNGFLHLLVWEQDQMKIVVVDVQGKARRMVPVPHAADTGRWMCCFGESQGKLHYMTQEKVDAHERKFKLSIWVFQGYDTKEWVLKHTVDTHEVFGEEFEVFDIHQDCNVVFLTQPLRRKLVAHE